VSGGVISPVLPEPPIGRRRRPSGEPPPLRRPVNRSTRWLLALGAVTALLWVALAAPLTRRGLTHADLYLLRGLTARRVGWLTTSARGLTLGAGWATRAVEWTTIAMLVGFRRFQHLATYLVVLLAATVLDGAVAQAIARVRPSGVTIAGDWQGYAHPSRPVAAAALAAVGAAFTLRPRGRWRARGVAVSAAWLVPLCLSRLYLAVDHPTDVFAGLVVGAALPVAAYRLAVPDQVFPVSYRRGTRAHLDVGGRRGEAIVQALDHQLGLDVVAVEPFGLEGSAGSTPLKLTVRLPGTDTTTLLFAKLYALVHLRSDRWYKLVRAVLYGRLEDEKPFSSVRRLVEYEDHMLRLLRDAGLPTPKPYGFVELTPVREYLIVMEFFPDARPLASGEVSSTVADEALAIVRRLWDAGVAHRDIKPSNVLVHDGHTLLIDVAFATVRPTPWRQAVDLHTMMLTLALGSSAATVYERALQVFAPDDIGEAFAACRGVTLPTQLRGRLAADRRDLVREFRALAPRHPPVAVQLWTVRRFALTLGLVTAMAATMPLLLAYGRTAGLW
jgi:tRNA A-37 threonylcarbamoyl transferase component Bud32/membrane-associated phospholipid phosphatase